MNVVVIYLTRRPVHNINLQKNQSLANFVVRSEVGIRRAAPSILIKDLNLALSAGVSMGIRIIVQNQKGNVQNVGILSNPIDMLKHALFIKK